MCSFTAVARSASDAAVGSLKVSGATLLVPIMSASSVTSRTSRARASR